MSIQREEEVQRCVAKRKTVQVLEIVQGKSTVAEVKSHLWSAAFGDQWLDRWGQEWHGERLGANPQDVRAV